MRAPTKSLCLASASLLGFSLPAMPAAAQSAAPAEAGGTVSGEIVVTASKRAERLLDVPQSVTALTSADLAKLGAKQLADFLNTVPGVQFTSAGAGQGSISVRGVSTGADIGRTVATYVDDVPYGSTAYGGGSAAYTADVALFDLDRVELLRGPQGTLYGASSMGGLLKYVTRAPSLDTFGGAINAGIAGTRFGGASYDGNAVLNLPIVTDKAAVRASAFYSRDGGYVDNIQTGQQNVGRSNIYGGRLDLLLKPVDRLTVRLTGFSQNIRRNGGVYEERFLDGRLAYGSLDQSHPLAESFRSEFRLVSANLAYDFGGATLTSVSSYQDVRTRNLTDFSNFYAPYLRLFAGLPVTAVSGEYGYRTKKFTQEVRLASEAGKPIEWQLGGFYTHETAVTTVAYSLFSAGLVPFPLDFAHATLPTTYREVAAFGNATWHLSDRFDVTGGVRWSHNAQSYTQNATGIILQSAPTSYSRENVTTWLANARYHFSRNVMAYARFATGYRPGGPNVTTRDFVTGQLLAPSTFASDTLRSYEAGIKADSRDRTFSIDASGYFIDWKNIQLYNVVNGNNSIVNVGGAHIAGAELVLTARPDAGTTISGAFAYNDGYLTAADAGLGAAKGERLPNSAHVTATINADYVLRSSAVKPALGATLRYTGDRTAGFDASAGSPQYRLPDYIVVDLRAGFTIGPVDLQAYVHNLFDQRPQLSAQTSITALGAPAQITILRPRTIGLRAGVKY
jgi:iron complex outermembrane receptor protein